ncbi:hypothetical protein V8D89_008007, partial [Ganoderma adspersum]
VNEVEGEPKDRQMTTARNHTVRDIYCCKCKTWDDAWLETWNNVCDIYTYVRNRTTDHWQAPTRPQFALSRRTVASTVPAIFLSAFSSVHSTSQARRRGYLYLPPTSPARVR